MGDSLFPPAEWSPEPRPDTTWLDIYEAWRDAWVEAAGERDDSLTV